MPPIKKQYVVDEHNRRIAVQLDLATFLAIEQLLEDHVLAQHMVEVEDDEALDLEEAKTFYSQLDKTS